MRPPSTLSTVPTCTPSAPMTSICSLISIWCPFEGNKKAPVREPLRRGTSALPRPTRRGIIHWRNDRSLAGNRFHQAIQAAAPSAQQQDQNDQRNRDTEQPKQNGHGFSFRV